MAGKGKGVFPHLAIEISEESIKGDAVKLAKLLNKKWSENAVIVEHQPMGFSNKNFYCHLSGGDGFLIRLITTEMEGLKEKTVAVMRYNARHSLGAKLLCTFKNGVAMEWIVGEGITWEGFQRIKEEKVWRGVAEECARYHASTNLQDVKELGITESVKERNDMVGHIEAMYGALPPNILAMVPPVKEMISARNAIFRHLEELDAEMCYCHMETSPTNVVIQPDGVVFVDYDSCYVEFACLSVAGILGACLNVFTKDISHLPTQAEKDVFYRAYLEERKRLDPSRGPVTDKQLQQLSVLVEKAGLMAYLDIAMAVAYMQTEMTDLANIDLIGVFMKKYADNKDRILALTLPK